MGFDPALFDALQHRLDGEVHSDPLRRHLLATDGSIFQVMPAAVVYPRHTRDVVAAVRFAAAHGLSVHPRGAGSGLCGAALGNGLVIDFTRFMHRLLRLAPGEKSFTCEPGYRLGELEVALMGTGLFFPPDPSSGEYATFGGMFATNASGAHSVKYGNVADYVVDAEVVLADGAVVTLGDLASISLEVLPPPFDRLATLYDRHRGAIETGYPDTPFNSAGYNLRGLVSDGRLDLRHLLAGAEGTLGIATRLTFRLRERPPHDSLVVAYMDDIVQSARAVQAILPRGPAGIEVMDKSLLGLARSHDPTLRDKLPEDVDNILLVEFDGLSADDCARQARDTTRLLQDGFTGRVYTAVAADEKRRFWAVRKAAVPILYKLKGRRKILALIEDASVPVRHLVPYFEGVYTLLQREKVPFVVYGHIAKGLLHTRPLLDLKNGQDVARLRTIADAFFELVAGLDGTVSGEHGDGRLRSAYIRRRYPAIYDLFLSVKRLMDPAGQFNPEIITHHDPGQMQRDLRYGGDYRRHDIGRPALFWPEKHAAAIELCHGCSKCTTVTNATRMCPVYKVTRDEAAAPKAKANLLRALLGGRIDDAQQYASTFMAVMDQCVHCGSCRHECPSNVDIPKLALEAKARYAQRFGNPLHDHLVSRVELAGRLTRKVSALLAPLAAPAVTRRAGERLVGFSSRRDFVPFARQSLFERVGRQVGRGPRRVIYYAGCYAAYIRPEIGEAAVHLLVRLGWTVLLPEQHCCGLPMLSKGMVDGARRQIRKNLGHWHDLMDSVAAVVVTCSSCGLAVMEDWADVVGAAAVGPVRDKLRHISPLILEQIDRLPMADRPVTVAYHTPCHLKVQPRADSSLRLLGAVPGVDVTGLNSRCCGMAGSWGLHADHDALSRRIGADLMDRIAASGAMVAATDCPTCRMQMEQMGPTPVFHPVEIVAARLASPARKKATLSSRRQENGKARICNV